VKNLKGPKHENFGSEFRLCPKKIGGECVMLGPL
jgi:hypothetical protein